MALEGAAGKGIREEGSQGLGTRRSSLITRGCLRWKFAAVQRAGGRGEDGERYLEKAGEGKRRILRKDMMKRGRGERRK